MIATAAQASIQLDSGVSPFSSTIDRTPVQGTISNDAGADTRCYKQDRYMFVPLTCAKQTLGLCHDFSRVIKIDGHAEAFFEKSGQWHALPSPTWYISESMLNLLDYATHANPYSYNIL